MKHWYKISGLRIELGKSRDFEPIPNGCVEINEQDYGVARAINNPYLRKLENGKIVQKTKEEQDALFVGGEKESVLYKICRKSYRETRQPFDFNGKNIRIELNDLRRSPHGVPFQTWDTLIRDAVMCELSGNSVLPITLMRKNEATLVISTSQELYALHKAMVLRNKSVLEQEASLRSQLKDKTLMDEVKAIRVLNSER